MTRRYAAEFVGTFGIVFAPVALSARGNDDLGAAAWVSGLSVLAMIYALGPISAAHFNPAVTLGFALAGRFPWRYVLPYALCSLAGGTVAASMSALLLRPGGGAHVPTLSLSQAVGMEAILTFLLMLVIMAVATDRRVSGVVPALAIGLTVVFDVFIGGPVTGGSMNPARSFGPALFAGGAALSNWWVYVVGPLLGAALAARLYEALRPHEHQEHACGAPNDLFESLRDTRRAASES